MDEGCATFLTGPAGGRLLAAARATRGMPPHGRPGALSGGGTPEQIRAALTMDDLRRRAQARFPEAERLLFTRTALEQATAWTVGVERAGRYALPPGTALVDLTAGIGLDTLAAASTGVRVIAYEKDPVRATFLEHNARALGLAALVETRREDALAARPTGAVAFFDPGRRSGGVRSRDPATFDPPRATWDGLLARFERAIVKLPPVLEGHRAIEGPQEIVSLGGRARERRWYVGAWCGLPALRALALPSGRSIEGGGLPWPGVRAPREGDWLFDPDVSVTVAGLVGDLAARDGLAGAHPRVPYLVADASNETAPGHWMQIDASLAPKPKAVNAWLAACGVGNVTIRKRGIEERAAAWRRKLKPRGPRAGTLVFTCDERNRWVCYACLDATGGGAGAS